MFEKVYLAQLGYPSSDGTKNYYCELKFIMGHKLIKFC